MSLYKIARSVTFGLIGPRLYRTLLSRWLSLTSQGIGNGLHRRRWCSWRKVALVRELRSPCRSKSRRFTLVVASSFLWIIALCIVPIFDHSSGLHYYYILGANIQLLRYRLIQQLGEPQNKLPDAVLLVRHHVGCLASKPNNFWVILIYRHIWALQ